MRFWFAFLLVIAFGLHSEAYFKTPRSSSTNSWTTVLADGATHTGDWELVEEYSGVKVAINVDAPGTLYMQFSQDKDAPAGGLPYQIGGGVNEVHGLQTTRKWYRTIYTDTSDGVAPTSLDLETILGHSGQLTAPANLTLGQDSDAIVTRNINFEDDVIQGKRSGNLIIKKFGVNNDVDTGITLPEDIWAGGGVYTGFPTGAAETIEVFSSDANDTSGGTGCRTLRLEPYDSDMNKTVEDITLNGTTAVLVSATAYTRLNRMYCLTAGTATTNIGTITARHTTTTANIFATLPAGTGQTAILCYTVEKGYTGYLKEYGANLRDGGTQRAGLVFWTRWTGGAVRSQRSFSISNLDGRDRVVYGGLEFPEKTDICMRVESMSSNNAIVGGYFDMLLVKQ